VVRHQAILPNKSPGTPCSDYRRLSDPEHLGAIYRPAKSA